VYEPFVSVAIDTLGPFPTSPQGHKYVFVIVCCFSSFTELILFFDNTAIAAAHALLQIFGRYGATFYLRSDNAPNFAGHVMQHFRSLLDISDDFTIPYRPASNGIVERKNREVLAHLRALLFTDNLVKLNWHYLLPIAQRICNATDVASLGCSPAQLIFGNSIHLNRGLDSVFQPIFPTSQRVGDYIKTLCDGQTALIRASQKHLAHVKDVYLARTPQATQLFPTGAYVLIAYPTDFRPKMANQLRGPFRVISSISSMYQVQSFTDPDRLISIHCSRLRDFHADESHIATSLTAYILGGASLQLLLGPISDRFGRRPVMLLGSALFSVVTLLLPSAHTIDQFLVGRFFEGMGLCYIHVVGYALLQEIFSDEDDIRVIAIMANVSILAPLFGPLAGSVFLQYATWRAIFYCTAFLSWRWLRGVFQRASRALSFRCKMVRFD
jgi:hypothetical protein